MSQKFIPYIIIVGLFISFLLLYTAYDKTTKTISPERLYKAISFQDSKFSLNEMNKVFALEAIGLISIALVLGPFSRILPKYFSQILYLRKPLGVGGFIMGFIHGIYSLIAFYQFDIDQMIFQNSKIIGFLSALIALFIFLLMTLTSSKEAMERMGYKKWKTLQTFGYIGLLFALVHFFVFETKPIVGLDVRPYGLLFFYLAAGVLLLRLAVIIIKVPEHKSYEEHVGEKISKKTDRKRKEKAG